MPPGTASTVANVAEAGSSHRLFQNDCTKSGCSNTARNQRNENPVVGRVSVSCGVKATRHTPRSGASMKAMTRALNSRAMGPFFCMPSAQCLFVMAFQQPLVSKNHDQICQQQSQRNH